MLQETAKEHLQELFCGLPEGVRALLMRELVEVKVTFKLTLVATTFALYPHIIVWNRVMYRMCSIYEGSK